MLMLQQLIGESFLPQETNKSNLDLNQMEPLKSKHDVLLGAQMSSEQLQHVLGIDTEKLQSTAGGMNTIQKIFPHLV